MFSFFLFSNFCLLLSPAGAANDYPEVDVSGGHLKGSYRTSDQGSTFMSFEGIPFAAPPVGPLRFQNPQPADPWDDSLDVSGSFEVKCTQFGYASSGEAGVAGSEDCLYLNVWAPEKTAELKPVMMWIYGGSLTAGSSAYAEYGPMLWMDKDVILVSPNYRLGPFGFTSLGVEGAKGNQGFRDLVAALQWIQDNIEAFGGDPNSVTIFGESSGSWCVSYLTLTPLANGLFHRAILQSGAFATPQWLWDTEDVATEMGYALAIGMNCSSNPPVEPVEDVLQCLRDLPMETLEQSVKIGSEYSINAIVPLFRPKAVVEGEFLAKSPVKLMESGDYNHVQLMVGLTSEEGLLFSAMCEVVPELYGGFSYLWDKFGPVFLFGRSGYDWDPHNKPEDGELAVKIAEHYLGGNTEFTPAKLDNITNMFSDSGFFYGAHKQAEWAAKQGDTVYQYMFKFKGTYGFLDALGLDSQKYGVCHADELWYIWKPYWFKVDYNPIPREAEMGARMLDLWTNFARLGDPTPPGYDLSWEQVEVDNHQYMVLDEECRMELSQEYLDRMAFWDDLWEFPQ